MNPVKCKKFVDWLKWDDPERYEKLIQEWMWSLQ